MISPTPAAILFIPIAVIASVRRKWALSYLLLSVPLFHVKLFVAVGHQFTLPEIAMIALGVSQVIHWLRTGKTVLAIGTPIQLVFVFLAVCVLSVVNAVINPADVLTHAYNSRINDVELVQMTVTSTNFTQLLLRTFFVGSVFVLYTVLVEYSLRRVIRGLVLGSVFVGIVGIVYQLFLLSGTTWFAQKLYQFGHVAEPNGYGFTGPIPRMGSTAGEPGHTAQYILFTFPVTVTLWILNDESVMSHRELSLTSLFLFFVLIVSTSTTAYGGLIIFTGVAGGMLLALGEFPVRRVRQVASLIAPVALIVILVLGSLQGVQELVLYQIEKLSLSAGSGSIRQQYLVLSVEIAKARPLLGIGTGSYYSTSLAGTLLGETGFVGLLVFVLANVVAYTRCLASAVRNSGDISNIGIGLFIGGMTVILTSLFAKSITTTLAPWYWFTLALPMSFITTLETDSKQPAEVTEE